MPLGLLQCFIKVNSYVFDKYAYVFDIHSDNFAFLGL